MQQMQDDGPFYVGVDVGGTNVKVGVVSEAGRSLSRISIRTLPEQGPERGLERIGRAVDDAVAQAGLTLAEIHAVGLATPGTMDIPAGLLLEPPNLPGWDYVPIRQRIGERLGKPTILQNDANAAAYGEFWVGAARDVQSLVFWTLGTGIGCGLVIHDMIIEGRHSHGSECGHIIVQMDGGRYLEGTKQYGTLEAYASARSLIRRCREELDRGRSSLIRERLAGGEELTPVLIGSAADAGDELADELIMDTAKYMGVGTTTLMHTVDPDMVLFGGAMTFGRNDTPLGRRFLQRIRDEVKARAFPVPYSKTVIDYATLGGNAGYIGAAGCARRAFGPGGTLH